MKVQIEIEGTDELIAAFRTVEVGMLDLRQLGTWDAVAGEFYRIEKEIFASEGGTSRDGKWKPLSLPYATAKRKKWGDVPILQASGRFYRSMTSRSSSDSVFQTAPQELTIGSTVPYGRYHQRGTGRMPSRKAVSFTDQHLERLAQPISMKLRQLIANARLKSLRGF
jgi:phage gpG-like protein